MVIHTTFGRLHAQPRRLVGNLKPVLTDHWHRSRGLSRRRICLESSVSSQVAK